jgi:ribosomal protein L11 methyltransferase
MDTWIEYRLTTSPEYTDACAQLLLDAGCSGVQVDDCAVLFDESEDATLQPKTEPVVIGYYTPGQAPDDAERAHERILTALQKAAIPARLETGEIAAQDWSNSWRENFPPLRIGPFLIIPSWEPVEPGEAIPIHLDPGLAFGTGQHPTTRLCLELLAEKLQQENAPRLLDVGCGSGILSIAAAKLGAQVTASDLDPFCVRATIENTAANGVDVRIVEAAGLEWVHGTFDVVVANLMSDLLINLAPSLAVITKDGGSLIVSGISAPRADDVEAALHQAGYATVIKREAEGETRGDFVERWAAFVLQRV